VVAVSIAGRFWEKVEKTPTCWLWTGAVNGNGYGNFNESGRYVGAHRVAYELVIGPIPADLTLDHLCRVRLCVNPSHLEPVTNGDNVRRGMSVPALNARKTHCKRGHPFDARNTYRRPDGSRQCRACRRIGVPA